MSDITARRETESSLAEAEARYRALVEQTPRSRTWRSAERGTDTLYMSPQTASILGYTPEEWYDDDDLFEGRSIPRTSTSRAGGPTANLHQATYRLIAKDGRSVWIHDQARMILDDDGHPMYWQGVLIDITEQRHSQELERDLTTRARGRATPARRRRDEEHVPPGRLARPPDAARRDPGPGRHDGARRPGARRSDETRDLAGRIAQNARKLDRLVTDLLDLERMNRGIVEP